MAATRPMHRKFCIPSGGGERLSASHGGLRVLLDEGPREEKRKVVGNCATDPDR